MSAMNFDIHIYLLSINFSQVPYTTFNIHVLFYKKIHSPSLRSPQLPVTSKLGMGPCEPFLYSC